MTRKYQDLSGLTPEQKKARAREQTRAWYKRVGGWQYEKAHRDPVKTAARQALRDAVKSGRMMRGACEVCGRPEAHGHHDDYSKPLEVRWLCSACHAAEHVKRGDRVSALNGGPVAVSLEKAARILAKEAEKQACRAATLARQRVTMWWKFPENDLFG